MTLRFFGLVAVLLLTTATQAAAQEAAPSRIRVAALYGGVITNEYVDGDIKLKDSGLVGGLYLHWIETDYFQANLFLYHSPDVNYSKVWGLHANGDAYFFGGDWGSVVAGIDIEDIEVNLDAGDHVAGLEGFKLENNVLIGMARGGARVHFAPSEMIKLTVMPYAGVAREISTGEATIDPAANPAYDPAAVTSTIDESSNYFVWGTNLTARIYHMVEITLKYLGRAEKDHYRNSYTGLLNVYPLRNLALSYQFKHMEVAYGSNQYNMLGVGYVF